VHLRRPGCEPSTCTPWLGGTTAARLYDAAREVSDFDAIVVGSGMTGGWGREGADRARAPHPRARAGDDHSGAGLRRAQTSLGVAVPGLATAAPSRPPADAEPLGLVRRGGVTCSGLTTSTTITTPPDRPFYWFRGAPGRRQSTIWGRQVYRPKRSGFRGQPARRASRWIGPSATPTVAPWYNPTSERSSG